MSLEQPALLSSDSLLDSAPCGFLSFTDDGTIFRANRTLLEWLGYTHGEMVGRKVEALLTLAGRIFYQTHFFPLIKLHGKVEEIFLSLLTKGGETLPVIVSAIRRGGRGAPLNDCVLLPVPTRRQYEDEILRAKRAAEEALHSNEALMGAKVELERHAQELDRKVARLEQKNQELHHISRILAHDLRQPTRKIAWFAEFIREEHADALSSAALTSLAKIHQETARIDQLLKILRQYVSVDVTDDPIEEVDLNAIVARAKQEACNDAGGEVILFASDTLPVVEGYREQLVLLFFHLFDNAIKFRRSGEAVGIRIDSLVVQHNSFKTNHGKYRYVDFAKISFRDEGVGFDPKYGDYVFEVLTKVKQDSPGLGFGLAICKKVVENHGGTISLESEPGKGTTLTVLLPIKR